MEDKHFSGIRYNSTTSLVGDASDILKDITGKIILNANENAKLPTDDVSAIFSQCKLLNDKNLSKIY